MRQGRYFPTHFESARGTAANVCNACPENGENVHKKHDAPEKGKAVCNNFLFSKLIIILTALTRRMACCCSAVLGDERNCKQWCAFQIALHASLFLHFARSQERRTTPNQSALESTTLVHPTAGQTSKYDRLEPIS